MALLPEQRTVPSRILGRVDVPETRPTRGLPGYRHISYSVHRHRHCVGLSSGKTFLPQQSAVCRSIFGRVVAAFGGAGSYYVAAGVHCDRPRVVVAVSRAVVALDPRLDHSGGRWKGDGRNQRGETHQLPETSRSSKTIGALADTANKPSR